MRIAIGIEYDGGNYVGWQRQRSGVGVQDCIEKAIAVVADEPVETICAGRTDTGVHATGQVAHFDTTAERSERSWILGINSNLPDDINVTFAKNVSGDFHARFSAELRTYHYLILNRVIRSSLHRNRAWWVYEALDEQSMLAAAQHLLGKHDFSAFRAAGCQAPTPVRTISVLDVARCDDWIEVTVSANAFLQHMVRNIIGTLTKVGRGDKRPDWARSVLENRNRQEAGIAAPPHGLTFVGVDYPESLGLPRRIADTPLIKVYDSAL